MNYEKLPKTISAEELLSTPLPPVKWIIPDFLPAGLALFAGPSKAGKSWLTLWLCLQVAQGKPMWGREIEPHTVLYLRWKTPSTACKSAFSSLWAAKKPPNGWSCRRNAAASGRGWKNSSQVSSISTRIPD